MATHSNVLAWRIPGAGEPGGLTSMGSHRVGHNWSNLAVAAAVPLRRRQWHPTPVLLPGKSHGRRSLVGCSPWGAKSQTWQSDFTFTLYFHALEKEMATHSSVLAWRIPGTGEPGGLLSMVSHRVGHDWATSLSLCTFMHWRRKWQPTPVFLPGESQGWGSLVGCHLWSRTESDKTEVT